MNKRLKQDAPGSRLPFVGRGLAIPAPSLVALSRMAAGVRQQIILPEIICFRKVAQ
jgi:hypothetical protein